MQGVKAEFDEDTELLKKCKLKAGNEKSKKSLKKNQWKTPPVE